MLSDEQLDVLSGALAPLFQNLEAWVITDVARRIKNTMMYTRTAELEVEALQKLGYSPARIRAEVMCILRADKAFQRQVEENTLAFKREVAAKLAEITGKAQEAAGEVIDGAGDMSWADDISLWDSAGVNLEEDGSLKQITQAIKDQTQGVLKNLTRTTGFRTASGMEPVKEVYQKELDKALVKVSSGAVTREQCAREVVKDLARSGLRTIDYDSGRSYQLDTASRMCMNTAAGQLAAQVCNSNIQKTGVTMVQVSAHWGARDKGEGIKNHKDWQGKVYSIDGQMHPEEEKRIGMEIRDLQECTGYSVQDGTGDIEGLHGVNCRHNHHPFFEGVSTPVKYDPEPEAKEINGRTYSYYDVLQGMRRREREIRALKREKEALEKLGEDATDVKAKIRLKTKEYNSFCDICEVRQKPERLRVESGTTDLTKTQAWKAYQKARQEAVPQRGIISGIRNIKSQKELKALAGEINLELDEICEKKSKWSGQVRIDGKMGEMGRKEWSCDVTLSPDADYGTVLHELLHSRSISYYDARTYLEHRQMEEGSVELLTAEICRAKKIQCEVFYFDQVKALRRINRRAKMYTDDYEYARSLFNVDVPERVQWLVQRVNEQYTKGVITATELDGLYSLIKSLMEDTK